MSPVSEERYDSDWITATASEAAEVIRAQGLNGDRLAIEDTPRPPGATVDAAVARARLNDWVRTAHRHNYLLLPVDLQQANQEATSEPEVLPTGHIDSGVGVVTIPGLSALDGTGLAAQTFSCELARVLTGLDADVRAWLFNLTSNGGGNMHPMLAGLVPVLGIGRLCGFRSRDDVVWVTATYESVLAGDVPTASVPLAGPLPPRPTAVLIGPRTASSGEWVALAVKSRCRAAMLGQPSAGLLTGVEVVELSTGAAVGVTTVTAVDHMGEDWPEAILPDMTCQEGRGELAAIEWLIRRME